MTSFGSEEDSMTEWLRAKLLQERILLEQRHNLLLAEFQTQRARQVLPILVPQSVAHVEERDQKDIKHGDRTIPSVHDGADKEVVVCNPNERSQHIDHVAQPALKSVVPGQTSRASDSDVSSRDSFDRDLDISRISQSSVAAKKTKTKSTVAVPDRSPTALDQLSSFITTKRSLNHLPRTFMARIVTSSKFELFFACVIFANMLEMALDMQYRGFENGRLLNYPKYNKSKEEVWPGMEDVFVVTGWMFGVIYTIELLMKMIGLQLAFFEKWNLFDVFIVLVFYFEKFARKVTLPIDTMILRMFRLFKVLRLLRLVHEIAGLGQLLLMVTALKGSLKMLAWATMLLYGIQTVFAFILNQLLSATVIENEAFSPETRRECFKYFGSYTRAIFSMFELTLSNWIPISRFLVEDISAFLLIFVLMYKLTLGFAVVGVVNACFIKETFKIVNTDRTMMVIEKTNEKAAFRKEMMRFMAHADTSHDGNLNVNEFVRVCHDEHVQSWLGAQGLDASDATSLFELMDDGSGYLESKELIRGVAKLKGPSRSLDLAVLELEMCKKMDILSQRISLIEEMEKVGLKAPDVTSHQATNECHGKPSEMTGHVLSFPGLHVTCDDTRATI